MARRKVPAQSQDGPAKQPSTAKPAARSKDKANMADPAAEAGEKNTTRIVFDEDGLDPSRGPAGTDQAGAVPDAGGEDGEQEDGDDDEGEDEDDDDAPEAVSTAQLASELKRATQEVQKAAREEAATRKRKRRDRDVHLKQQAEARQVVAAESAATAAAAAAAAGEAAEKRDQALEDSDGEATAPAQGGAAHTTRHRHTPLLPVELLTDSDSDSDGDGGEGTAAALAAAPPRPKRRKVATVERQLARELRAPADRVVGMTVYRVLGKSRDERLAPAGEKYSANAKLALLKRNRTPARRHVLRGRVGGRGGGRRSVAT